MQTIAPLSALPSPSGALTIDGLSQPGASCASWPPALRVELSGANGVGYGLNINTFGGGSSVRGLVINRFAVGVGIGNVSDIALECNYIGTSADGASALPNTITGVQIQQASSNIRVGGSLPSQRNLIAGNPVEIDITNFGLKPTNNWVENNYIGTNAAGTARIGSAGVAVDIFGADGTFVINKVIVSGGNGITIDADATRSADLTFIQGNKIGTNAAGTAVLGNSGWGIELMAVFSDPTRINTTTIGGPGKGNLIAGNGGGIRVTGTGTLIEGVVERYRALNGDLAYVVLVGGDDSLPFFRYPDQALLGNESTFAPPVQNSSASQASLRLVDRPALQVDGAAAAPACGGPAGGDGRRGDDHDRRLSGRRRPAHADQLLRERLRLPLRLQPDDRRRAGPRHRPPGQHPALREHRLLPAPRHLERRRSARGPAGPPPRPDLPGRPLQRRRPARRRLPHQHGRRRAAGHTRAARQQPGDQPRLPLRLQHRGRRRRVRRDRLARLGPQAFARKGATLIAGTGYQYGDTAFAQFAEELYIYLAQQLRAGDGPVAIGSALAAAKQRYLLASAQIRGVDRKTLAIATLYGLPMMRVDMPGERLALPAEPSIVGGLSGVAGNPYGLCSAEVTVTPTLSEQSLSLTQPGDGSAQTATYLSGADGVVANPAERCCRDAAARPRPALPRG